MWEHLIISSFLICLLILHCGQLVLKAIHEVVRALIQLLPAVKELIELLKSMLR